MTDELVEQVARVLRERDSWRNWKGPNVHDDIARAVIPLIYNAAIEDAARVADREWIVMASRQGPTERNRVTSQAIAAAIRALAKP